MLIWGGWRAGVDACICTAVAVLMTADIMRVEGPAHRHAGGRQVRAPGAGAVAGGGAGDPGSPSAAGHETAAGGGSGTVWGVGGHAYAGVGDEGAGGLCRGGWGASGSSGLAACAVTKESMKQQLAFVSSWHPGARPTRGNLKQVFQFARSVWSGAAGQRPGVIADAAVPVL